jgi:hypothetical protein
MSELNPVKNDYGLVAFDTAKNQIKDLSEKCLTLAINNDSTLAQAKEFAKLGKSIENYIEEKRKMLTKPLVDKKKEIDDVAKDLKAILDRGVKPLRDKILNYEQEKLAAQQAEMRRIAEEKRKKEEELRAAALAESKTDEVIEQKVDELVALQNQEAELIQNPEKTSIRKVWTFDVVDIELVPRDFLELNSVKVNAAIKGGMREIPGLNIYQKDQLNLR